MRQEQTYTFDFFNYAGIHRTVFLYSTPQVYIDDVIVNTDIQGFTGKCMLPTCRPINILLWSQSSIYYTHDNLEHSWTQIALPITFKSYLLQSSFLTTTSRIKYTLGTKKIFTIQHKWVAKIKEDRYYENWAVQPLFIELGSTALSTNASNCQ